MAKRTTKPKLYVAGLKACAREFALLESDHWEATIFGATDGKAVGTYLEKKFRAFLEARFAIGEGNAAYGIDLPSIDVDIKTTSVKQPQSSCPFRSATQKVYGLGYSLLVFVYDKQDNARRKKAQLTIHHVVFVDSAKTADFQTTSWLRRLLENDGNVDDIVAYFQDKNFPLDDIQARDLAERVIADPPEIGALTISNALQWRLQYGRAITSAGSTDGVERLA